MNSDVSDAEREREIAKRLEVTNERFIEHAADDIEWLLSRLAAVRRERDEAYQNGFDAAMLQNGSRDVEAGRLHDHEDVKHDEEATEKENDPRSVS